MANQQKSSKSKKVLSAFTSYHDYEAPGYEKSKLMKVVSHKSNNTAIGSQDASLRDDFKYAEEHPSTCVIFNASSSFKSRRVSKKKSSKVPNISVSNPLDATSTNLVDAVKAHIPLGKSQRYKESQSCRKTHIESTPEIKMVLTNKELFYLSSEGIHRNINKEEYSQIPSNDGCTSKAICNLSGVSVFNKAINCKLSEVKASKPRSKYSAIVKNDDLVSNAPGFSNTAVEKNYLSKRRSSKQTARSNLNPTSQKMRTNTPTHGTESSSHLENIWKQICTDKSSNVRDEFYIKRSHVSKKTDTLKSSQTLEKSNCQTVKKSQSECSMTKGKSQSQPVLSRVQSCERFRENITKCRKTTSEKVCETFKTCKNSGTYSKSKPVPKPLGKPEKGTENKKPLFNDEVSLLQLGFPTELNSIDRTKFNQPLKVNIFDILYDKVLNYVKTDFVVHIDDEDFHCHHLVLNCYTRFFDDKLGYCEATIPADKISKTTFQTIYDWMVYDISESNKIITPQNILRIFRGARFLKVKILEEQCWFFMDQETYFSEHTAFNLYTEAMRLNENEIVEFMLQKISRIFLTLVATEDYLDLQVHEICPLLTSSYIATNSELEVLLSGVRWLMHDWDNRKLFLLPVMSCIRFGLIDPQALVIIKHSINFPELIAIMQNCDVDKMRRNGLTISVNRYWAAEYKHSKYYLEDESELEPEPRNFYNRYYPRHGTYRAFLFYLEAVRNSTMGNTALTEVLWPAVEGSMDEIFDVHINENYQPSDSPGSSRNCLIRRRRPSKSKS